MEADDARNKFLKQILADLEAGSPKSLQECQALFPGHDEAIAEEYERVPSERESGETHALGSDIAEGESDSSSALLTQLSEHSPPASRYELKGEFARGGMGAILKVWDKDLRRNLAMKVVLGKEDPARKGSTPTVDERTLGRFPEEAQVTGQLDHPGVVPRCDDVYGRLHGIVLCAQDLLPEFFSLRILVGIGGSEPHELVHSGRRGVTHAAGRPDDVPRVARYQEQGSLPTLDAQHELAAPWLGLGSEHEG